MNKTKIDWTNYTWNPITGCLRGCEYCYARRMSNRFYGHFKPAFHPERLNQPFKIKKPTKIFVCSMGDVLGEWVEREWIMDVLDVVRKSAHITFQFLTKNPGRYTEFFWPPNAWLGATATNQKMADKALDALTGLVNIKYLSCEPLLAPVELKSKYLEWLIIGACTGPMASQPEKAWVESLTAEARNSGIAIFYKDNLIDYPNPPKEFPDGSMLRK